MSQQSKNTINKHAFALSFSLMVVASTSSSILFMLVTIALTWYFYKKIEDDPTETE